MGYSLQINPRLVLASLAMLVVLPGAMCSSTDPATMDRKEMAKMVLSEGAMEVFKGKGTGSVVSAIAATPEGALNLLKADLRVRRDELEYAENQAAAAGDRREEERVKREVDWVQANLDCIGSGGKNCSKLQELTAARRENAMKANEGEGDSGGGGGGHSD